MSFFGKHITNNKISLSNCNRKQNTPEFSPVLSRHICRRKKTSRRALPGNMTVEAALVLPLFLFAIWNLLSLLLMFQTFSVQEGKLHQTGRSLSLLAYGQEGDGEEEIRLVKVSRVKALFPIVGFPDAVLVNGCVMHKWIGYDPGSADGRDSEGTEEMVYVTKEGSAYHRRRSCVYLNPSVQMMGREEACQAVNKSGHRYSACESCGGDSPVVYVTKEGIRYHSTAACSGLRRSIDCIPLREALQRGRHACPSCG